MDKDDVPLFCAMYMRKGAVIDDGIEGYIEVDISPSSFNQDLHLITHLFVLVSTGVSHEKAGYTENQASLMEAGISDLDNFHVSASATLFLPSCVMRADDLAELENTTPCESIYTMGDVDDEDSLCKNYVKDCDKIDSHRSIWALLVDSEADQADVTSGQSVSHFAETFDEITLNDTIAENDMTNTADVSLSRDDIVIWADSISPSSISASTCDTTGSELEEDVIEDDAQDECCYHLPSDLFEDEEYEVDISADDLIDLFSVHTDAPNSPWTRLGIYFEEESVSTFYQDFPATKSMANQSDNALFADWQSWNNTIPDGSVVGIGPSVPAFVFGVPKNTCEFSFEVNYGFSAYGSETNQTRYAFYCRGN